MPPPPTEGQQPVVAVPARPVQRGQPVPSIVQPAPQHEWECVRDADGRDYWFNTRTGVTQWERPEDFDQPPQNVTIFMGIPIEDPTLAPIIKRVMFLSAISAMLIIIDGIVSLAATGNVWFIFLGMFMLLIPACGYCGAKNKSRDYMCCFCGWSFACFVITFINVVVVIIFVVRGKNDDDGQSAGYWVTSLVINFLSSVFYFLSFHYGKMLHQNPYFEPPELTGHMMELRTVSVNGVNRTHSSHGRPGMQPQTHHPPPLLMGTVSAPVAPNVTVEPMMSSQPVVAQPVLATSTQQDQVSEVECGQTAQSSVPAGPKCCAPDEAQGQFGSSDRAS